MTVAYLVTYTIRKTLCPSCGRRIRWGYRRFGPSEVKCGHCGTTSSSNLKQWLDFSTSQKIGVAINELLFPSWTGIPVTGCSNILVLVLLCSFLCMIPVIIGMVPLDLLKSSLDDSAQAFVGMIELVYASFCGMLIYPTLT
jgi:hypothetical protein